MGVAPGKDELGFQWEWQLSSLEYVVQMPHPGLSAQILWTS